METVPQSSVPARPEPTLVPRADGRWNAYNAASAPFIVDGSTREEAIAAYYAYQPPTPSTPLDRHPTRRRANTHTLTFGIPEGAAVSHRVWQTTSYRGPDGEQFDIGGEDWAPPVNPAEDDYLLSLLGMPPDEVVQLVRIPGASLGEYLPQHVGDEFRRYRVLMIGSRHSTDEDDEPDYRTPSLELRAYIRRASWAGSPLYFESHRRAGGTWSTTMGGIDELGADGLTGQSLAFVARAERLLRVLDPQSGDKPGGEIRSLGHVYTAVDEAKKMSDSRPTEKQVAGKLGVSERTVQRFLRAQTPRLTFRDVLHHS